MAEPKEGGVAVADPKKSGAGPISLLLRATIEGYGSNTDPAPQVLQEASVTAGALWSTHSLGRLAIGSSGRGPDPYIAPDNDRSCGPAGEVGHACSQMSY